MEVVTNKKNLVAIVTGASQGIGKYVAEHFLKKQFKVVAADINDSVKNKWWETNEFKTNLIFIKTDVSKEDDVKNMVKTCIDNFGSSINVLVNNAAIANPYQFDKTIEQLSYDEWNKYIAINLSSVFLCCKYIIPYMKFPTNGSIINISSTRSLMSEPNSEAYAATKGGVNSLTHALALSYGKDRIRVNCVAPGWIHTASDYELKEHDHDQHVIKRVGKVEDIAEMVDFLSDNEKSGFITGQTMFVDGGMTKKMIYTDIKF